MNDGVYLGELLQGRTKKVEEKIERFQQYVAMIRKVQERENKSVVELHGMVHLFYGTFDAAVQILRTLLYHDGGEVSFMTPVRELVMEAYERYAFIDDEVWMDMIRERDDSQFVEDDLECEVMRIWKVYIPAMESVVNKACQTQEKCIPESY